MNTSSAICYDNLSSPGMNDSYEIMLDRTPQPIKPPKGDPKWGSISRALANNRERVTVSELADLLTSGCTFCPGVFRDGKRSNATWVQQQLFGLDFDHGYRIEEFQSACDKWKVHPAFVYPTFSHTEEDHRFRAVFVHNSVVTDKRLHKLIQGLLARLFATTNAAPDKACMDPARMFCGTNKPLVSRSFNSRISAIGLIDAFLNGKKASDPSHYADWEKMIASDYGIDHRNRQLGVVFLSFDSLNSSFAGETSVGVYTQYTPTAFSPTVGDCSVVTHNGMKFQIVWSHANENQSKTKSTPKTRRVGIILGAEEHQPRRITESERVALLEQCQLLSDFITGRVHVKHHGRRILITNLRHIEGGSKWYLKGLAARDDYGHETLSEDARRYRMKPEGCCNCAYANNCAHKTNLIQQIPVKRRECRQVRTTPPRDSLEHTRTRLRDVLRQCMDSTEYNVYVIRCDTGVGKTEEMLNQDLDGVCVAFDTHRLKNEAHQRLRQKGQDAYLWPEPPQLPEELANRVRRCYAIGLGGTAEVYRQALEHPAVLRDAAWTASLQGYLKALKDVHIQRKVLATHEKAYQLQPSPKFHTFVFDEDFAKTLIRVNEVKIQDINTIRRIIRESDDEHYSSIDKYLKAVLHAPSRMTHRQQDVAYSPDLIHTLLRNTPKPFASPIEALFTCDAYRKDSAAPDSPESVFCITRQKLRDDKKYVVLSATADEQVYRMLFGDRLEFINLPGTELKGKLVCHTGRSYSKQGIAKDWDTFATKVLTDKAKLKYEGIITHKVCTQTIGDAMCLKGTGGKVPAFGTFGGLQGLDSLGGIPIAVYGTPYPPEYVVKLWASVLGLNTDEDIYAFAERPVQWSEYELSVPTCSEDERLQRLYLWLAHSEIVQAVGRARLVNHECEVHVFAKLPVSGCVLAQ